VVLLASLTPPRGAVFASPRGRSCGRPLRVSGLPGPRARPVTFCAKSGELLAGGPSLAVLYAFAPLCRCSNLPCTCLSVSSAYRH